MDVLLIIDMQEASVSGDDKHDIHGVVRRINRLSERVRSRGGLVVFVLHDGAVGEDLEPLSAGCQVLKSIETQPEDRTVRKKLNDSFRRTDLASVLKEHGAQRVIVSGWASDLCVEATVWSAIERGFEVVVAADCHTVSDRPHLSAGQVIAHHNWLWSNLISTTPVRVLLEREI